MPVVIRGWTPKTIGTRGRHEERGLDQIAKRQAIHYDSSIEATIIRQFLKILSTVEHCKSVHEFMAVEKTVGCMRQLGLLGNFALLSCSRWPKPYLTLLAAAPRA